MSYVTQIPAYRMDCTFLFIQLQSSRGEGSTRLPIGRYLPLVQIDKHALILLLIVPPLALSVTRIDDCKNINRRILHQPLFPSSSSPPPPPPSDTSAGGYNPDQPFFPEAPNGQGGQNETPAIPTLTSTKGPEPFSTPTQPTNPTKKVAIVVSVGIVTLGMLCALSFYFYKHKLKHRVGGQTLEGGNSHSHGGGYAGDVESTTPPPSSFLYIGTVEHSNHRSEEEEEEHYTPNRSPYRKFNPVKKSDRRYRPSPDLQPLPPLSRAPPAASPPRNSTTATALSSSEEDEGSRELNFYTPHGSIASTDDGFSTPVSRQSSIGIPYSNSKRSSRSRIPASSHDVIKHAIIPSIKATPPPPPPPLENRVGHMPPRRAKFGVPPPPPNLALLQAISNQPPPPPPPPPPHVESEGPKVKTCSRKEKAESARDREGGGSSSTKPKLKPLHWDKVRATSDRATAWDHIKTSSFQLNEDRMESLFGNNSENEVNNEVTRRSLLPLDQQHYRILDPKKSQNIAILLRALNVTRDEVSEALLDGNPEALGAELLETLVKMAPTKEEEIKLKGYKGDDSKLGSAEKFLKTILDIPFAFKRVEAMLYRANFDAELKYLRKSFDTLEEASGQLRNSSLFLKLLEAVLTTGNRMNVGTNRGGAESFKLDTLLKLVDIKGVDGKTTLLHFVVQEIIRSEGMGSVTMTGNPGNQTSSKSKEEEFRSQGLQVVSGLSREIGNVKLAAGMDSDVLHNYVSKLETGLEQVRTVLQYESLDTQGRRFFESMKAFVSEAEEGVCRIKHEERKALMLVREVTEYFHGDAAKEEAHPFRIFVIVRDFLSTLDHVCKDVGTMQDRPVMGAARTFRVSSNAPLPVLSRYNITQNDTSSEESSSP